MLHPHTRVKLACYTTNISMSIVGNLSAILFITFRSLYGISYSLLGLLVFINFFTQLVVDVIFSFFSHVFNISRVVKLTPVLTILGLLIYALWPFMFPGHVYAGLVIGTLAFSASAGLCEVLISPVIAALPAENPDHEMSKLHSVYAWGVVFVIVVSTVFLFLMGKENWQYLALLFAIIPLVSAILFAGANVPRLETPEQVSGVVKMCKSKTLWLCVSAIFLGGASECTMAQWSSGYMERALGIPKLWGDLFGVALFSVMLGLGRTLYSKYGKNIGKVLFFGALGATVCYLVAVVSSVPVVGLIACAFTGFCVSMLWPGSLIVASDHFPAGGVFIYAMMAAGGDFGASVAPQFVGVITDGMIASDRAASFASATGVSLDQLGMKCGMLVGMLFSLCAMFVYLVIWKSKRRRSLDK